MDGEMPDGGAPLPPEAAEYVSYIPQEGKEGQEFYKYERLILQMVVRYGEKVLCNVPDEEGKEIPITVTEYVVNDLKEDELAFHNRGADWSGLERTSEPRYFTRLYLAA